MKKIIDILLSNVGLSFSIKAFSAVLSLILSIVLARMLGAEGFGIYAFSLSMAAVLGLPVQVGLPTLLLRETAKYELTANWGKLSGIFRFANKIVLILSAIVLAGLVIFVKSEYVNDADMTDKQKTIFLAALLVPIIGLSRLRESVLQGAGYVLVAQIPDRIVLPMLLLSGLVVANYVAGVTPVSAMTLNVFGALVVLLANHFLAKKKILNKITGVGREYEVNKWLKSVMPLSILAGINLINSQIDIIMLGFIGEPVDVANYKVAFSFGALVIFAMSAIEAVLAPTVVRLYGQGHMGSLQKVLTRNSQYALIAAVPVAGFFVFFGGWLIGGLYGSEYQNAYMVLVVLCVAQIINAGVGSVHAVLNLTGHEKDTLKVAALAAIINVILNFMLIPTYGALGSGVATGVAIVFINLTLLITLRQRTGLWSAALPISFIKK